jgi:hypothetical protein
MNSVPSGLGQKKSQPSSIVQNDRPLPLNLVRRSGLDTAWTISPCLLVHSQNGLVPTAAP